MLPILFQISSFQVSSLGVVVGIGFFLAFFIIWRRLKEMGLDEERVIDAILLATLVGFLGARLSYVLAHFADFRFNLVYWFSLYRFPGLSFWGAVVSFLLGFSFFARRQRWDILRVADELTFGLVPLAALVYFGAFLDGSFLGSETGLFWGVFFPGDMIRRHPVALFQSLLFILLWLFLLKIERIWRSWEWYKSQKVGFLTITFFGFSGLFEFWLAFLKAPRLYSSLINKLIGLFVFIGALAFLYWRAGRNPSQDWLILKA